MSKREKGVEFHRLEEEEALPFLLLFISIKNIGNIWFRALRGR